MTHNDWTYSERLETSGTTMGSWCIRCRSRGQAVEHGCNGAEVLRLCGGCKGEACIKMPQSASPPTLASRPIQSLMATNSHRLLRAPAVWSAFVDAPMRGMLSLPMFQARNAIHGTFQVTWTSRLRAGDTRPALLKADPAA